MNVLFIGNSYTFYNDMPLMVEALARSNGKDVSVRSITKGSRKLESYADPSDPTTQALDDLLARQSFDACFIQEQSHTPVTNYDGFLRGLECVTGKLKGRAEHLILYATWGRNAGNKMLTDYGWTTEHMAGLLSEAYQKAASHFGADVSPVGSNFLHVTQNHPEIPMYAEDCTHPSYQGSCLAALTHYRTLFGEFPERTDALNLTEEELAAFRAAVCR